MFGDMSQQNPESRIDVEAISGIFGFVSWMPLVFTT